MKIAIILSLLFFSFFLAPEAPLSISRAAEARDEEIKTKLSLAKSYMRNGLTLPQGELYTNLAINEYSEVLKLAPAHKEALVDIASIYVKKGMFADAEKALKTLVEADRGDMSSHISLARLYYASGNKSEAIDKMNWVIENEPRNGMARLVRAVMYEESEDMASAINECKSVIRIAAEDGDADLAIRSHLMLANLYYKANLFFDEVGQYEKMTRIWPDLQEAYIGLASACYRLGFYDKAINALNTPLHIKFDTARAHLLLALNYYKKGDYGHALSHFKSAKALGAKLDNAVFADIREKLKEIAKTGKQDEKGD